MMRPAPPVAPPRPTMPARVQPSSVQHALRIAQGARFKNGGMPVAVPNIAENVTGGLHSPIPGRTDHLPISVPDGAYIIPADVVSALGQGNTMAGMTMLDHMLGMPSGPAGSQGKPISIAAAGGEYVVSPQAVAQLGNGNIKQGHATLDAFVKKIRSRTITKLRKMPGPVKAKA